MADLNNFTLIKYLSSGAFGDVILACRKSDGVTVCIKINHLTHKTPQEIELITNEGRLLKIIDSPYVIKCYSEYEDSGKYILELEYAKNGTLSDLIKHPDMLSEHDIWKYLIQTACGLYKMHKLNILHRDIKPANLFLAESGDIKIGDLGMSRKINITDSSFFRNTFLGSPAFCAPELIKQDPYNGRADVWSLGVLVYELCTKKLPFPCYDSYTIAYEILNEPIDFSCVAYSSDLLFFLTNFLQRDPNHRMTLHDFLSNTIVQTKAKSYPNLYEHIISVLQTPETTSPTVNKIVLSNSTFTHIGKPKDSRAPSTANISPVFDEGIHTMVLKYLSSGLYEETEHSFPIVGVVDSTLLPIKMGKFLYEDGKGCGYRLGSWHNDRTLGYLHFPGNKGTVYYTKKAPIGSTITIELDLRSKDPKKRTLCFALNSSTIDILVINVPELVQFAIQMNGGGESIELVSFTHPKSPTLSTTDKGQVLNWSEDL